MKMTVVGTVFCTAQSAGLDPPGERFECDHICWDPKDGERCLNIAITIVSHIILSMLKDLNK
jgi:hypothetical protein